MEPEPGYDITQAAFVDAQNLHPGDELQTPTGSALVVAVRLYHADTTAYDLTIADLHTYYVIAGDTPVLVHNCAASRNKGGFFARLFGRGQSPAEAADAAIRANRVSVRLGDLANVSTPDVDGSALSLAKAAKVGRMDDTQLIEAINDPNELGGTLGIANGEAYQGNHRLAEALARMNDPNHPDIDVDTQILATIKGDLP